MKRTRTASFTSWRFYLVCAVLSLCILGLIARLVDLTTVDHTFLLTQGNERVDRVINTPAPRGMITDRNGKPLAISTLVHGVWMDPKEFSATDAQINQLSTILQIPVAKIKADAARAKSQFVYLKRDQSPAIADQVKALNITGIHLDSEYRRFYSQGEVVSPVVGLTNIDNQGVAGIELSSNATLTGQPGKEDVLVDRKGNTVDVLKTLQVEKPGQDVHLSIDQNLQYEAYEVLEGIFKKDKDNPPEFGSIVVLNPHTGEVLAMANYPAFNPNSHKRVNPEEYRNHAMTDVFEPGSIMKTFAAINALDSGRYTPSTMVATGNGRYDLDGHLVQDDGQAYGTISLTDILKYSSNVGMSKVTLSLNPPSRLYNVLQRFGFGKNPDPQFPGSAPGFLVEPPHPSDFGLATLSFGYSMSASVIQLAAAYGALANDGILMPVSLLQVDPKNLPQGVSVVTPTVAKQTLTMLLSVLAPGGTGLMAAVPGYEGQVAGKTGTAYLAKKGGYHKHQYISSFVGIAPMNDLKHSLVVAVVLYDSKGKDKSRDHFGGLIAGPAFSKVMGDALSIFNSSTDNNHSSNLLETPVTTG